MSMVSAYSAEATTSYWPEFEVPAKNFCPADAGERWKGGLVCLECPAGARRVFDSERALAMHKKRAHAVTRWSRMYVAADATCPACQKRFTTREKALVHLARSKCAGRRGELTPLSGAQLQLADPGLAAKLQS